jgi:ubiquitin-conjugating enzyme (huntingtin interacting protein 2)
MAANRNRRLQKEIQDIAKEAHTGYTITSPSGSAEITDFTRFKGSFKGPPDTPYEGGTYEVDIQITNEYPFKPPKVKFITHVWHPNISSQTGAICLDTLGTAWSPVLTLKSTLITLQGLLASPEPSDPQDAEVASMMITRPEEFKHWARDWAQRYAGAPKPAAGSGRTGGSSSGGMNEATLKERKKAEEKEKKKADERRRLEAYRGYNERMIDQFTSMGFAIDRVVGAFEFIGVDKNEGQFYDLDEDYVGDITARLCGEM